MQWRYQSQHTQVARFERVGMARSDDMINWQRYQTDPVVAS